MNEMFDYKPNSHASKERDKQTDEKRVKEKVVKGTVKTKKKNGVRKFTEDFIPGDVHDVKTYIFSDVLIPAIKDTISDIVKNGVDMILFGVTGRSGRKPISSKISYSDYYGSRNSTRDRFSDPRTRISYSYDDIILESRGEAEEVLCRLDEIIDLYGVARVADLHDLVGVTGNYTDNHYGWTNLRNADVVRVSGGGYRLKLPKALPIK